MNARDRIQYLLSPVLTSPWTYGILLLTLYFAAKDLASINPSESALIAIPSGLNDAPLTILWFLSALSLVAFPLVVLWQEQIINKLERTGFLSLLFASSISEGQYRSFRLQTAFWLGLTLAVATALVCGVLMHHSYAGRIGTSVRDITTAVFIIYLPNICMAGAVAATLTRVGDRAIAITIGVAAPFLLLAAVGLVTNTVSDQSVRLWLSAFEPTGTLYFSELQRVIGGRDWESLASVQLMPLLLNRLSVVGLACWFGATYLHAPSIFEEANGLSKSNRATWTFAASQNFAPIFISLVAAFLTVSNVLSNFTKNLAFYELRPHMAFLFSAAMPGTQAFIVVGLMVLVGKLVWDDAETGFSTLKCTSAQTGMQRLGGIVARCSMGVLVFYAWLVGAIGLMFSSNRAGLDLQAIVEYILVLQLPGLALATAAFIFVSTLSPNRMVGYLLSIILVAGFVYLSMSEGRSVFLEPFPHLQPGYDTVLSDVSWPDQAYAGAALRFGLAAMVAALAGLLLGRNTLRTPAYVSKRNQRGVLRLCVLGAATVGGALLTGAKAPPGSNFLKPSLGLATRYEKAAMASRSRGQFRPDSMSIKMSALPERPLKLAVHYRISNVESQPGSVSITWAIRRDALGTVEVDGEPAVSRWIAPALLQVDVPEERDFDLDMAATLSHRTPDGQLLISSVFGHWPTLPVIGVLPELFTEDERHRRRAGLPSLDKEIYARFHPAGVSRPTLPVSISVAHACGRSAGLPFSGQVVASERGCVSSTHPDLRIRQELVFGIGNWNSEQRHDQYGRLTFMYPKRNRLQAREFVESTRVARSALGGIFRDPVSRDISILLDHNGILGSSNALSKPGLVLVSDVSVLGSALSGEARRRREVGLMAHELTHQWFGHAVRPKTGIGGAVFVNEMPAEFVRAYVIRDLYGEAGYRIYLSQQMSKYQYILQTQSEPESPALTTGKGDTVYARSSMLSHFLGATLDWNEVARRLEHFVSEHANKDAVTSEQLFDALTAGLDDDALRFARLLVATDVVFTTKGGNGFVTAACTTAECNTDLMIPAGFEGGRLVWKRLRTLTSAEAERSLIGPFILIQ